VLQDRAQQLHAPVASVPAPDAHEPRQATRLVLVRACYLPAVSKRNKGTSLSSPSSRRDSHIVRSVTKLPDGTAVETFSLDTTRAPVPARRYVAEVADVSIAYGHVRMLFGQRKLEGDLRSLIIITLPPETVRQFVTANLPGFLPLLHQFLSVNHIATEPLTPTDREPSQTVLLSANVLGAARLGREAVLDFFSASPWFAHKAAQNQGDSDEEFEPVVRVSLRTSLLVALLDKLSSLVHDLPPDAK